MTRQQFRQKVNEIRAFMRVNPNWRDIYTQWEKNFVDDMHSNLVKGWTFSDKQESLVRKLWRKI